MWGPVDHSWPYWVAIRSGYLILGPLLLWSLLTLIWNRWQPSEKLDILLVRILSGAICIGLLVLATFEAISESHIGNTHSITTRDGREDVGEDIVVPGPSWGNVFLLVFIALLVFWAGVLRKGTKASE